MSSTTATTSNAAVAAVERQTYWCHECDMSVSLLPSSVTTSSSSLLCPHCHSDFLEQMDSSPPLFNPNPNPNPNLNPNLSSSFLSSHQTTPAAAVDDNYLLDSPYLHRLIQHLTNSESENNPFTSPVLLAANLPASKSSVEAIPTIRITASFLDLDPILLCAVCKDQFLIDGEAKQLPCKHVYHSDCILPWLSQHNSCPVCRFRLPAETGGDDSKESSRWRSRLAATTVAVEEEDLFGFESTLRHIARRHRAVFDDFYHQSNYADDSREADAGTVESANTVVEDLFGFESTLRHLARRRRAVFDDVYQSSNADDSREAEAGIVERANSVETVSSWPRWVIEGGNTLGGGGGGDGDMGVSVSDRVNDDNEDNGGDTVMY